MTENIIAVTYATIKYLKIPVTKNEVADELYNLSSQDNILTISDLLFAWNIESEAYNINISELDHEFCPFIATVYLEPRYQEFVLVTSLVGSTVLVTNHLWKEKAMSLSEFTMVYGNVALIIDKETGNVSHNHKKAKRKQITENLKFPFFCLLLTLLTISFVADKHSVFNYKTLLYLLAGCLGTIISFIMMTKDHFGHGKLFNKYCSTGNGDDCEIVSSSKSAKLFDLITWAEIGFMYFSGCILSLLLINNLIAVAILFWLSISALPFILYSIFLQALVIKKWCIFCCITLLCLAIQFLALLSMHLKVSFSTVTLSFYCKLLFALTTPGCLWFICRDFLVSKMTLSQLKMDLSRFKFNRDVFFQLLENESEVNIPNDTDAFTFGNQNGQHTITIVSNPLCTPCIEIHKQADFILETNKDFKVQIILAPNASNEEVILNLISHHQKNPIEFRNILNNWYSGSRDLQLWKQTYPIDLNINDAKPKLNYFKSWCHENGVDTTPSVMLNGHLIPSIYNLKDLKDLLEK